MLFCDHFRLKILAYHDDINCDCVNQYNIHIQQHHYKIQCLICSRIYLFQKTNLEIAKQKPKQQYLWFFKEEFVNYQYFNIVNSEELFIMLMPIGFKDAYM